MTFEGLAEAPLLGVVAVAALLALDSLLPRRGLEIVVVAEDGAARPLDSGGGRR